MTTTHPASTVPKEDHLYEVEPRMADRRLPMIEASHGKRPDTLLQSAVAFGERLLAEEPDLTGVGVYHTHPSPGPVRRYVLEVTRP